MIKEMVNSFNLSENYTPASGCAAAGGEPEPQPAWLE